MAKVPVQFTLNGEEKAEFVDSGATLIRVLRDKLGDTSPKGGCRGRGGGAADHRRQSQRLVSQRGFAGAFPSPALGVVRRVSLE